MKKIIKVLSPLLLLLVACGNNVQDSQQSTIGESTSEVTSESTTQTTTQTTTSETIPDTTTSEALSEKVKVSFDNLEGITAGTSFTNDSNSANKKKLIDAINTAAGVDIIKTITCVGPVVMNAYGEDPDHNRTLCLGSGSDGGELTFIVGDEVAVNKIEVEAQIYNKYVSFNSTWNIDAEANLKINGVSQNLGEVTEGAAPATVNLESEITGTNIVLSNEGAGKRVLIHSITFEYVEK